VPECELVQVGDAHVLLINRFDRRRTRFGFERMFYISAVTALQAAEGEQRDYLEILDFIKRFGSRPEEDTAELLRRIRYTIAINNTDDHLRNHGFVYEQGGWHLSPLFDVNPNPNTHEARQTALGGFTDVEGSLKALDQLEQQL